jgi:hypothetical protein
MPATSHRRSVNRTVDDATPTRRAISRVDIPAFFNLTQSRTWRIDILSIGIGTLLGKADIINTFGFSFRYIHLQARQSYDREST